MILRLNRLFGGRPSDRMLQGATIDEPYRILAWCILFEVPRHKCTLVFEFLALAPLQDSPATRWSTCARDISEGGHTIRPGGCFGPIPIEPISVLYCAGKDRALQLDGFMQRWYPAMSDAHWNESHLSRYDEYFGYWCFCRGGRQTSRHSRRSSQGPSELSLRCQTRNGDAGASWSDNAHISSFVSCNAAAILAVEKAARESGATMRLLLIEDEKELAAALAVALSKHGIVTDQTAGLADAFELTLQNDYDAILLDRRLPDGEGLTLIPMLRRSGRDTPIIVMTARNEPLERVKGLDIGADDYLGKPFLVEELMARVRAVLRRPTNLAEPLLTVGRMSIDPLNLSVAIDAAPFDLPRRELLVLVALAKRKDKTVLRSTLEAAVYNYEEEIQSNALDAHISRLRKRLLDAGAGIAIHNIRGVGYLLKDG